MPFVDKINRAFDVEICERKDWNIFKGTHMHDCYEIYYMEGGEINYFVEERIYRVRKGEMILIPPGVMHKTMPYLKQQHKRILIYIAPDFLKEFAVMDPNLYACFEHTLLSVIKREAVERILYSLHAERQREEKANLVLVKCLLGELLTMMNRWTEQDRIIGEPCVTHGSSQKIMEVVKYINQHFREDLRLPDTAKKFYLDSSYLSRTFHRVIGLTYSDYLVKVRVRQAARLLLETDQRVTEIAEEVGFHSDNHFCKTFKKVVGISPLQYRKREGVVSNS